ncbi:MAG: hypothetical protein FWG89_08340 [Treponema sp.]|nr:hypothetical protein [Treponema sp.]
MKTCIASKYVQKYQKITKRFTRYKYEIKKILLYKHIIDYRTNKLVKKLKKEEYNKKKSFVDAVSELKPIEFRLHPILMFNEIILPVFESEYDKNNPHFIKLIGDYCSSLPVDPHWRQEFFKKHNIPDSISVGGIECQIYFYEKSYIIDRNQDTLDKLMDRLAMDILINWLELPTLITMRPARFIELVKPFEERLEICKKLCAISDNDKWDKRLADWELLIQQLYQYREYVKENGNVDFNDYLKEMGIEFIDLY